MEKLNTREYLFHGIRDTQKKDAILVLEDILISGALLTHDSLRKKGIVHERECYSHQGSNAISLCFHPENFTLFKKFENSGITLNQEKPAFIKYVNIKKPSIILNKRLLDDLTYRQFSGYPRTIDEIQITEDIPLSYIEAIGINLKNTSLEEQKYLLMALKDLLIKYHYDIPIINPYNGEHYHKGQLIK